MHMAKHKKRKSKNNTKMIIFWMFFACIILVALLVRGVIWLMDMGDTPPSDTQITATTTVSTTVATTVPTTDTTTTTKPTTVATAPQKRYIQPAGGDWKLKLANDWNTLPADYDSSFTAVEYGKGLTGKLFDSRAVDALRDMLTAANTENPNLRLQPVSCFRSVALQKSLYERQVNTQLKKGYSQEKAEEVAATIVKRPGQSEHNTGLAVDLGGSGNYSLVQSFENTASFKWLIAHCADYGFILRFPKNKETITGVIYEPWHYRYVGVDAAKEIMRDGLCLEEYLEKYGL